MDYKELVRLYRSYAARFENGEQILLGGEIRFQDALREAADAIEALLKERDAAAKYIPRSCQTCKWWDVDEGCIAPAYMGGCLELRELWQWRGQQKAR